MADKKSLEKSMSINDLEQKLQFIIVWLENAFRLYQQFLTSDDELEWQQRYYTYRVLEMNFHEQRQERVQRIASSLQNMVRNELASVLNQLMKTYFTPIVPGTRSLASLDHADFQERMRIYWKECDKSQHLAKNSNQPPIREVQQQILMKRTLQEVLRYQIRLNHLNRSVQPNSLSLPPTNRRSSGNANQIFGQQSHQQKHREMRASVRNICNRSNDSKKQLFKGRLSNQHLSHRSTVRQASDRLPAMASLGRLPHQSQISLHPIFFLERSPLSSHTMHPIALRQPYWAYEQTMRFVFGIDDCRDAFDVNHLSDDSIAFYILVNQMLTNVAFTNAPTGRRNYFLRFSRDFRSILRLHVSLSVRDIWTLVERKRRQAMLETYYHQLINLACRKEEIAKQQQRR